MTVSCERLNYTRFGNKLSFKNLFMVVGALVLTSGCSVQQYMWGAPKPFEFTSVEIQKYNYTDPTKKETFFRTRYDALIDALIKDPKTAEAAKLERNQVISELVRIVDANYFEYETAFREGKVVYDLWGDFVQLGLTTGVTLVGGAGLKTILGAAATAVKGFDLAVNQRLFEQRGVQALELQMRASRDVQLAEINTKITKDVVEYPLDMGLSDVTKYYYEGTLTRALQRILESAQKEATSAQSKLTASKQNEDQH